MGGYVVRAGDGGIVFRYQQYLAKNVLQCNVFRLKVSVPYLTVLLLKLANFSILTKFEIAQIQYW